MVGTQKRLSVAWSHGDDEPSEEYCSVSEIGTSSKKYQETVNESGGIGGHQNSSWKDSKWSANYVKPSFISSSWRPLKKNKDSNIFSIQIFSFGEVYTEL